ncbi:transporter substrate-binding domain-containing protein [Deefgea tanakiae]|uniref:Transporter substrate-binding domain-containing protein n=1 Tax=Deefgea tanakiae TaxID=2865840 RepID=A0ABX8Z7G9_9NEIS|nr:transporter substrate-binding domain-containing protein [Deefgea tanakiae]QZA78537.1 transporter substrate-binding domain-containing protein [Deefgea tanakiae]
MLIAHALLVCPILVSAMAFSAEEVIVYGDESYPPYSYVEAGEFKGIYVDYIRQLTANMSDYRVRISPVPWKRGLSMLKNGSAFALFPPYRFKERDYIQFYSLPLYQESVVVCNRTIMTKSRVKFPEDFTDVVIGINRGYLLSSELQSAITNNFVKVEEANGNETNLKKLAALHTACYINDKVSIFLL